MQQRSVQLKGPAMNVMDYGVKSHEAQVLHESIKIHYGHNGNCSAQAKGRILAACETLLWPHLCDTPSVLWERHRPSGENSNQQEGSELKKTSSTKKAGTNLGFLLRGKACWGNKWETFAQSCPPLSLADGTSSNGINPEWGECGLDVRKVVPTVKTKKRLEGTV